MELCEGFTIQEAFGLVWPIIIHSCDKIYEHESMLSRRKSGIGYGKKSDFTKDLTSSPGSSKYHLKTIFDKNRSSKKGFSMYVNREVSEILSSKFLIKVISHFNR